jgi:hypothetical protein
MAGILNKLDTAKSTCDNARHFNCHEITHPSQNLTGLKKASSGPYTKPIKYRPCHICLKIHYEIIFQTTPRLRSSVFWDITQCSRLKVNRRFGGTCRLHLQGWRISRARNQRESRWEAELWRRFVPPKRRVIFNGLHGVISQKIELFIATAVRTSNPTYAKITQVVFSFQISDSNSRRISYPSHMCYMSSPSNLPWPDGLNFFDEE